MLGTEGRIHAGILAEPDGLECTMVAACLAAKTRELQSQLLVHIITIRR